jgi:hypothetical protein
MVVIAHEAVGMHLPAGFLTGLDQCFEEILPVNVVQENVIPPVSPAQTWYIAPG